MASFYFTLLLVTIVILLIKVAWNPVLIFEYPYFMGAVFAVFIVPQAHSLILFPGKVSEQAVDDVMLMSLLCMLACVLGYKLSPSIAVFKRIAIPVVMHKLFQVGIAFVLISFIFAYQLARSSVGLEVQTQMSGITTVYLFFVGLIFPGFAICVIVLLRGFTLARLIITLIAGSIPLINVLGIRREPTVMLGLIIFLSWFYLRRRQPSRILIFSTLFSAMLMIPATGALRGYSESNQFNKISSFDFIGNFKAYFGRESTLELRNAAALIESTKRFGGYDFGAGYWNQIIFRYVPAQFIGIERKNAMMIGSYDENDKSMGSIGYEWSTGSTLTGMGDSFQHFGWFGCLFFLILAIFFRSVWLASLHQHAIIAQLLYILICTSAMRAVTHQTTDFLPGLIYKGVFLAVGMWYASVGNHSSPTKLAKR